MGWKGIKSPAPPCLKLGFFWNVCETSACCRGSGKIGSSWAERHRPTLMLIATLVSVVSLIFLIAAAVSLSPNRSSTKATHWSISNLRNNETDAHLATLYIGLDAIVIESNIPQIEASIGGVYKWSGIDCFFSESVCNDCKNAAKNTAVPVILAILTQIPQILTDVQRSTAVGDLNCQKMFGIVTGLLGFLTTLASLNIFSLGCVRGLPSTIAINIPSFQPITAVNNAMFGPGLALITVATLLKLFDVLLHVLLPTPSYKRQELYKEAKPGELVEAPPSIL
eukprot:m.18502 g.18502  ORF g.18502 m.18502 type:complete len:281 (-) comp4968_c0_seq2:194-1036(-)